MMANRTNIRTFSLGVCGGLLVAAALLLALRPAPTISLSYHALSSGPLFAQEIPYRSLQPLPTVEIVDDKEHNVLQTAVRRVRLDGGQDGIRIIVLKKEAQLDWI